MSEIIKADHVFFDVSATTVDEALDFISGKAVELGIADDKAAVLAAFKAREAEGSTGMDGFALPHAKDDSIKQMSVIVVRFSDAVAWKGMSEKPIKVAFALMAPTAEAGTTYLQTLAAIAGAITKDPNFLDGVLAATDPATVAESLSKAI